MEEESEHVHQKTFFVWVNFVCSVRICPLVVQSMEPHFFGIKVPFECHSLKKNGSEDDNV